MKKQLLLFLLALLPMVANADANGSCGSNLTWNYVESTQTLTISGTGTMYNYSSFINTSPWNSYTIATVVINNGVTSIGNGAFVNCTDLTSVTIPESVTRIGDDAFNGCNSLTSIAIPQGVTSIGESVFEYCSALTSVGDLSNCTSIGQDAFNKCSALTSVGNLTNCTSIGENAFNNCSALTSVGNLPKCTSIGRFAFIGCSALTSIDLSNHPDFGSQAFLGCSSLTSVNLSSYISIPIGAFSECSSLVNVGDLSACTSIEKWAFQGCSALTSIGDLSKCTSIGSQAFYACNDLTSVGNLSKCTSIGDQAFSACNALTSIGDLSACTSIGSETFSDCYSLTGNIDLPTCTSIGNNAFNGCFLSSITMPATPPTLGGVINNTGVTFLVPASSVEDYRAAEYWTDIKTQVISQEATHTYGVAAPVLDNIGAENFENVMSLTLSGNIDSEDIMYIRNKMYNLHHLDLTNATFVESNEEYMSGRRTSNNVVEGFQGYNPLRTIILPTSATAIGDNAFTGSIITNITFQEGITSIGSNAFKECDYLKSVALPEGLITIGNQSFYSCDKLSSVAFPSTLESIGAYAFQYCNLSSLSLPTSLKTISNYAFQSNSPLTELRIPSSVESIGEYAFANCGNLKDVYSYTAEPISINTNTFSNYATTTLHVFGMTNNEIFNNYYRNAQWGQFPTLVTFDDVYKYFYLNNDMELESRFGNEPDFNGKGGSTLEVVGGSNQAFDDVTIDYDDSNDKWGSLIADENVTANSITFRIPITGNRWRFFAFPFRVYLNKVEAPGTYVFRRYNGALRALAGASGWASLDPGTEYLEPGVGYIFQCNASGLLKITVSAPDFHWGGNQKHNTLNAHAADNSQHANWNFIGNPMTNYYDIDDMHYSAPLTIWNGTSYEAFRPGDDNYQLSPFEAFFVQKPDGDDRPTYDKGHRMGYNASKNRHDAKARRMQEIGQQSDRVLVNLFISDGTNEDRTRVVFNEKKTADYEMDCDAAKFMSGESVPQLYSVGQQVRYAINERPQGSVQLGFSAPKAGTYTIKAGRMDEPMILKDQLMGTTTKLLDGAYSFESEAGTFENRFMLLPANGTTAIEGTETAVEGEGTIYTLDGKQLPEGTHIQKGAYVVRQGNNARKVMK